MAAAAAGKGEALASAAGHAGAAASAASAGASTATVKVVVTGDAAVGKTSMLHSYTSDTFPQAHVPTVFDNYSARCWVNGEPLELSLWDTAGQGGYDPLRPLAFPGTHCFIVVCSVDSEASVKAMMSKWLVEIKHHNPGTPFILCCNKVDLLDADAAAEGGADPEVAKRVLRSAQEHSQAEAGCSGFFACSARTQDNLKALFDTAIRVGLAFQRGELTPLPPSKPRRVCTVL